MGMNDSDSDQFFGMRRKKGKLLRTEDDSFEVFTRAISRLPVSCSTTIPT